MAEASSFVLQSQIRVRFHIVLTSFAPLHGKRHLQRLQKTAYFACLLLCGSFPYHQADSLQPDFRPLL